jgi:MFS family permease
MSATSILATATLLKGGAQHAHAFADRQAAFSPATYMRYFTRPGLRERLLQFLFFITSFSLFISGFALFAERRFTWNGQPFTPREIGYVFGYVGFLGIVLQGGLIGRLVDRYGEAALVASGFLALGVGYFGIGLWTSTALLVLAGTLAAYGNGVIRPSLTSLITQQAGRHEQGVVLGLTQSLMSMASIVAPVIGGLLIQHGFLTAWAWAAAALALVGAALSMERIKARPAWEEVGSPEMQA